MLPEFYAGLDLGQSQDWTALAIVQRHGPAGAVVYHVRHLERPELGTPYPVVVETVAARITALRAVDPPPTVLLAIDKTGVGAPVVDLIRRAALGVPLLAITITGGTAVVRDGEEVSVPKRDLVSALQVLLQSGRLKVAESLPLAHALTAELMNFRVKISLGGHDSYGAGTDGAWREAGTNDDLCLAVGMAVWAAESRPNRAASVGSYLAARSPPDRGPFTTR